MNDFSHARRELVKQLAKDGIEDGAVLGAIGSVPRHLFLDAHVVSQGYADVALPIGNEQTISTPFVVAWMIELLRRGRPLHRVLEIGTGCGYQAAVLSHVAKKVYSVERIRPLHESAAVCISSLGINNVALIYGDGALGIPLAAPFDGIILACAGVNVPTILLDQLAIGGRLVMPLGQKSQHMHVVDRIESGYVETTFDPVRFVPLLPGTC